MQTVYSPAQVCGRLGISKSTLFRWETQGLIPAPERDITGERLYSQSQYEAVARVLQSRRHRRRFAQIVGNENDNARSQLEDLAERNALFKFVNLADPTGLAELREYSPLRPSTIRELLRVAADHYDPSEDQFWEIIDVVCETSHL